jgi:hypothetical protein
MKPEKPRKAYAGGWSWPSEREERLCRILRDAAAHGGYVLWTPEAGFTVVGAPA